MLYQFLHDIEQRVTDDRGMMLLDQDLIDKALVPDPFLLAVPVNDLAVFIRKKVAYISLTVQKVCNGLFRPDLYAPPSPFPSALTHP